MHLKMLSVKRCFAYIIINAPTVKKYRSYTSPKSFRSKSKPKPPRKWSYSSRLNAAAQRIQRTFRKKRFEQRPPTTRPSVQEMMKNIFSMKDLNNLRLSQTRRATGPLGSSRVQYHLGATGSW